MRARVHVILKNGVFDPQGKAIYQALETLGFDSVRDARQGKVIDLEVDETSQEEARQVVEEMCHRLLANTVIEDYTIEFG